MSSDRMTVVPDFLGELDAGVFMNKIAAALNTTALGVLNNGTKGKVVLTFDIERMGNSVEEKRVKIKHKLNYVTPTPRGKASEEDTTETPSSGSTAALTESLKRHSDPQQTNH